MLKSLKEEAGAESQTELTKDVHFYPDLHGNRSPIADPRMRGAIVGLELVSDTRTPVKRSLIYLAGRHCPRSRPKIQPRHGSHRSPNATHCRLTQRARAQGHRYLHVWQPGHEQANDAALCRLLLNARCTPTLILHRRRPRLRNAWPFRRGVPRKTAGRYADRRACLEDHVRDDASREHRQTCGEAEGEEDFGGEV